MNQFLVLIPQRLSSTTTHLEFFFYVQADANSFSMSFCEKNQDNTIRSDRSCSGYSNEHQCVWEGKCLLTSISRGDVVGAYRSTTFPCLSTRNFAKFHLIESPNNPPFCSFKNLYRGEAFSPFTSILSSEKKNKYQNTQKQHRGVIETEKQVSRVQENLVKDGKLSFEGCANVFLNLLVATWLLTSKLVARKR